MMELHEFTKQVDRLKATYGERFYPDERVKIIWQEVKSFASQWFEKQVSYWIATMRTGPLLDEIRSAVSLEREYTHEKEKRRYAKYARETFAIWQSGECGPILQTISKRITGGVSDSDWLAFMSTLDNIAAASNGARA